MAKETDFMKLGLYALAGFGAYALFQKYSADEGGEVVVVEDEPTSSFTGTKWQQSGRNRETMWQEGGVFENASGDQTFEDRVDRQKMQEIASRMASRRGAPIPWLTHGGGGKRGRMAPIPWLTHGGGGKRGRYMNMQGTQWQQTGQALNTGTNWQDASMNASGCGSCGA